MIQVAVGAALSLIIALLFSVPPEAWAETLGGEIRRHDDNLCRPSDVSGEGNICESIH